MKSVKEYIFEQEDFERIGITGLKIEYELTLRRKILKGYDDGGIYQIYRAIEPDDIFGIPSEHRFFLVAELSGEDGIPDIYEANLWAMSESIGELIISQQYSAALDMISVLTKTQDEYYLLNNIGVFNGLSKADVDEAEREAMESYAREE